MYSNEHEFTRLTAETSHGKIVWEMPSEELFGEDMVDAFNTLMIGLTFTQDVIYSSMANWLRDHAYDKYEITDIEKEEEL